MRPNRTTVWLMIIVAPLALAATLVAAGSVFTLTGSLNVARHYHTATLLTDGRVLLAGGDDESVDRSKVVKASAEIFDPASGTFTFTGSLNVARYYHTATLLADGRVLLVGGVSDAAASAALWRAPRSSIRRSAPSRRSRA